MTADAGRTPVILGRRGGRGKSDRAVCMESCAFPNLDFEPDRELGPGEVVRLTPGESIHIQQYMYHDFEVEPGIGAVLLGEVSQCNDDNTDNRFNPPVGRFPKIEEDEPPYRLLCNEYPAAEN